MNPWLFGLMVYLALLVLIWLFFAGVAVLEALWTQWEEEQIRRIAAANDGLPAEIDPEWFDTSRRTGEELPANWQELDGEHSFYCAWDEIRRRKSGGA